MIFWKEIFYTFKIKCLNLKKKLDNKLVFFPRIFLYLVSYYCIIKLTKSKLNILYVYFTIKEKKTLQFSKHNSKGNIMEKIYTISSSDVVF